MDDRPTPMRKPFPTCEERLEEANAEIARLREELEQKNAEIAQLREAARRSDYYLKPYKDPPFKSGL